MRVQAAIFLLETPLMFFFLQIGAHVRVQPGIFPIRARAGASPAMEEARPAGGAPGASSSLTPPPVENMPATEDAEEEATQKSAVLGLSAATTASAASPWSTRRPVATTPVAESPRLSLDWKETAVHG